MTYKILFVEDEQNLLESVKSTVKKLSREKSLDFQIIPATSADEALELLSADIDYAIIDIKLKGEKTGDVVLDKIVKEYRIPAYVVSGTPDIKENPYVRTYKKGEKSHEELLEDIAKEVDTGLFKIMGGRGIIEESMNKIFWDNLYKNIDFWKDLSSKREKTDTEKIILRYTIAHLQELLDQETGTYEPFEMYIYPILSNEFKTGTIVQHKHDGGKTNYVLLSPPCDLVIRGNEDSPKVETVILAEIEDFDKIYPQKPAGPSNGQRKKIRDLISNNRKGYWYWLSPGDQNTDFKGGFVNFLKIKSIPYVELIDENRYSKVIKLQESFVKSILSRFSSYYNRQGQPDFDFDKVASDMLTKIIAEGNDA